MKSEKTIKVLDKEVKIRYCAASETGFEQLSGKSSAVFWPTQDGDNVIPAQASTIDYIYLAVASIVAAYTSKGEDVPISVEQILYDASPADILQLINAVGELRNIWYDVPAAAAKDDGQETGDDKKKD